MLAKLRELLASAFAVVVSQASEIHHFSVNIDVRWEKWTSCLSKFGNAGKNKVTEKSMSILFSNERI